MAEWVWRRPPSIPNANSGHRLGGDAATGERLPMLASAIPAHPFGSMTAPRMIATILWAACASGENDASRRQW